jgi:hypothetical protein
MARKGIPRSWALWLAAMLPLFSYQLGGAFKPDGLPYWLVLCVVIAAGLGVQRWIYSAYSLPKEAL